MNFIKKLNQVYLKWFEKQFLKGCYSSIHELPLTNWIKLHEENNLKHLHKKAKSSDFSIFAYEKINDEIIDSFGASQDFLKKLKLKIEIEIMKIDNKPLIFIEIKEEELKNLEEKKSESVSFYDIIFEIEKAMQFKIDVTKLTVFEFYNYCKNLNKKQNG